MKKIITFEFDQIIHLSFPTPGKNPWQACYGTLPKAEYRPGALMAIRKERSMGRRLILHAAGNERIIKEALWVLGACIYFDKIVIDHEWSGR